MEGRGKGRGGEVKAARETAIRGSVARPRQDLATWLRFRL